MRYEIVDAKLAHLRALLPKLRPDSAQDVHAMPDQKARHSLIRLWMGSAWFRRVAFIDGEIAAVWGCYGSAMDPQGDLWVITAEIVEKLPVSMVRVARQQLDEMLSVKTTLTTSILCDYRRAMRFVEVLGFRMGDFQMIGTGRYQRATLER